MDALVSEGRIREAADLIEEHHAALGPEADSIRRFVASSAARKLDGAFAEGRVDEGLRLLEECGDLLAEPPPFPSRVEKWVSALVKRKDYAGAKRVVDANRERLGARAADLRQLIGSRVSLELYDLLKAGRFDEAEARIESFARELGEELAGRHRRGLGTAVHHRVIALARNHEVRKARDLYDRFEERMAERERNQIEERLLWSSLDLFGEVWKKVHAGEGDAHDQLRELRREIGGGEDMEGPLEALEASIAQAEEEGPRSVRLPDRAPSTAWRKLKHEAVPLEEVWSAEHPARARFQSEPAVTPNRVVALSIGAEACELVAFERRTGGEAWRKEIAGRVRRARVTAAGDRILYGTERVLFARSAEDGSALWQWQVPGDDPKDFGVIGEWAADSERVYVREYRGTKGTMSTVYHPSRRLTALDLATGEVRWTWDAEGICPEQFQPGAAGLYSVDTEWVPMQGRRFGPVLRIRLHDADTGEASFAYERGLSGEWRWTAPLIEGSRIHLAGIQRGSQVRLHVFVVEGGRLLWRAELDREDADGKRAASVGRPFLSGGMVCVPYFVDHGGFIARFDDGGAFVGRTTLEDLRGMPRWCPSNDLLFVCGEYAFSAYEVATGALGWRRAMTVWGGPDAAVEPARVTTFAPDTTPPAVSEPTIPDGGFTNRKNPTIEVTLRDNADSRIDPRHPFPDGLVWNNIDGETIVTLIDGEPVEHAFDEASGRLSFEHRGAAFAHLSTHRYEVRAKDRRGNEVVFKAEFTADLEGPRVRLIRPRERGYAAGRPDVVAAIEDGPAESGLVPETIELSFDGKETKGGTYDSETRLFARPREEKHGRLAEGPHAFLLVARDAAGNETRVEWPVEVNARYETLVTTLDRLERLPYRVVGWSVEDKVPRYDVGAAREYAAGLQVSEASMDRIVRLGRSVSLLQEGVSSQGKICLDHAEALFDMSRLIYFTTLVLEEQVRKAEKDEKFDAEKMKIKVELDIERTVRGAVRDTGSDYMGMFPAIRDKLFGGDPRLESEKWKMDLARLFLKTHIEKTQPALDEAVEAAAAGGSGPVSRMNDELAAVVRLRIRAHESWEESLGKAREWERVNNVVNFLTLPLKKLGLTAAIAKVGEIFLKCGAFVHCKAAIRHASTGYTDILGKVRDSAGLPFRR